MKYNHMLIKDENAFWNKGTGKSTTVEGSHKTMNRRIDEFSAAHDDSHK